MNQSLKNAFIDQNFFLLIASRFVSQLGDKFFLPAILWLALAAEGGSTARLGAISFVMVLPPILSAFVGVYVDRIRKKPLLITCDLLRFLLCMLLVVNELWLHSFWLLVLAVFFIEFIGSFFSIASASFIPLLVREDQLVKANSYLSGTDTLTSLIGYSVGGVIIATFGSSPLIMVNAVSFLVSGLLLLKLSVQAYEEKTRTEQPRRTDEGRWTKFRGEFMQGLRIGLLNRLIATLLFTVLIINTATASLEMLITIWVHDVLGLESSGFGLMLTLILLGSLVGGLLINREPVKRISIQVLFSVAVLVFGCSLALLYVFDTALVSGVVFFIVGICFACSGITFSTLVMKNVDKEHLGKVFGLVQTVTRGGQPLGVSIVTSLLVFTSPHQLFLGIGGILAAGGAFLLYVMVFSSKSVVGRDEEESRAFEQ